MQVDVNLNFTEAAVKELNRAKGESEHKEESLVRLSVSAGGCSGFMYGMSLVSPDDLDESVDVTEVFEDVKVVIDKKSLLYLDGITVDWVEDLNQRGFKFENPNADKGCGCGQSFSC